MEPARKRKPVSKPTLGAILLGCIPFLAICFSVPLWDRIHPMVLGLPFNLFWLILWIPLTTVCMWGAYKRERWAQSPDARNAKDASR
jgi:hypothetical protein